MEENKTYTKIVKEKLKKIEKRNKAHREEAKRLKIAPLSDGGWDDTINLESELIGMQIAIKSELEFLEKFAENLILGKRKRGQHKYNKIDIRERITDIKNALKLIENGRK